MTKVCGLCGRPPGHLYGDFFGGRADGVDLHHDFDRIGVGKRDNGTPIKVTCYEAYTVYGMRAETRPDGGVVWSTTFKLTPEAAEGIRTLMAEIRAEQAAERDCGA